MGLLLHDHPDSPNCRKVRLLLAAAQLPFRRRLVDLHAGGTRTPEFLRLAPFGKIPVLVDGPLVLAESSAILVYLAERYAPQLYASSPEDRARVVSWLSWQVSGAMRPVAAVAYERLIRAARGEPPDEARVRAGLLEWVRPAAVLEERLAEHAWLLEHLSIADLGASAWIDIADRAGMLQENPNVRRFLERLRSFSWWSQAGDYEILGSMRWPSSSSSNASIAP